jgi:uncharacterized protein with HEPN domain
VNSALSLPGGVAAALLDLARSVQAAAELADRGRAAFDDDLLLRLAAEAISNRLGEAVANIDAEWRDALPEVPWRAVRMNRNFVVHAYASIDYERLWTTLTVAVPALGEVLQPYFDAARREAESL